MAGPRSRPAPANYASHAEQDAKEIRLNHDEKNCGHCWCRGQWCLHSGSAG